MAASWDGDERGRPTISTETARCQGFVPPPPTDVADRVLFVGDLLTGVGTFEDAIDQDYLSFTGGRSATGGFCTRRRGAAEST